MREATDLLIEQLRAERLTYLAMPKLQNLRDAALRVADEGVPGDFIEAGVALGGSAILLARTKPEGAALRLYDVFSMIPAPGPNDAEDAHSRYQTIRSGQSEGLGGDTYYGYVKDLASRVRANLHAHGVDLLRDRVELVEGLFEDTLHPPGPVALAHIDCDWYDPVRTCIERILPRLSAGGIMVFDDYASYSGCRKAVDELMAQRPDLQMIFNRRSVGLRSPRLPAT